MKISRFNLLAIIALALCLTLSAFVVQRADARQADVRDAANAQAREELFLNANQVARLTPTAFRGLVADWYWMRSLQYLGGKLARREGAINTNDLRSLDLKLIVPLLETATRLDPQFVPAYEYIATVLPAVSPDDAIRLTREGAANNPRAWRLQHYLGYIYWQQKDYARARAAYEAGARIEGAPAWMPAMAARMTADGGESREVARAMYANLYRDSQDANIKRLALSRLIYFQSLDEREALARILEIDKNRRGRCVSDWRAVASVLAQMNFTLDKNAAPLDASNVAYAINPQTCRAELGEASSVPRK